MKTLSFIGFMLIIIAVLSCRDDDLTPIKNSETKVDLSKYPDYTEGTHSNLVEPNYSVVFNQNEVLRFDIKISPENWQIMQADLAENISSDGGPGGGLPSGGPPNGGPPGGGFPGGEGPPDGSLFAGFDPVWVDCSVFFDDTEWYKVGVRFKGNSSLFASYRSGIDKLSFKLDFDQFEDDYPDLKDQRFYGFKQLNLKNNYRDESLMREKVAADLFREFGLASSQVSFCTVYVDFGEGPQYFGVYTLVEEVDDSVLGSQFADETGNLYKPDGRAASFAEGTFMESQMELKNNEDVADYSDVKNLYEVINSSDRTNNPEIWKTNLENVFDVDVFLKWLASNTVIQNWDTYGNMTHNYYLYNNPENYLLTWIPWDNNEAFREGKQRGALSLSLDEVDSNWPLIRYLMDTPEYRAKYENYLQQFVNEVFVPEKLISTYNRYYEMLKQFAYAEEEDYTFISSDVAFDNAVEDLKSHVQERNDAVNDFLND